MKQILVLSFLLLFTVSDVFSVSRGDFYNYQVAYEQTAVEIGKSINLLKLNEQTAHLASQLERLRLIVEQYATNLKEQLADSNENLDSEAKFIVVRDDLEELKQISHLYDEHIRFVQTPQPLIEQAEKLIDRTEFVRLHSDAHNQPAKLVQLVVKDLDDLIKLLHGLGPNNATELRKSDQQLALYSANLITRLIPNAMVHVLERTLEKAITALKTCAEHNRFTTLIKFQIEDLRKELGLVSANEPGGEKCSFKYYIKFRTPNDEMIRKVENLVIRAIDVVNSGRCSNFV